MNLLASWQFLLRGGPVMIPIILVSVFCVALIVERYFALRSKVILPTALLHALETARGQEGIQALQTVSKIQHSPLSNIVLAVIEAKTYDETPFKEEVERVGRREAMGLEKNLVYLGILAALGPLLGLFGTVTGMISIFHTVQQSGVGSPQELSGGISESLLCTAGGMVIGIPALIFHRYFSYKVDRMVLRLEDAIVKTAKLVRSGL